MSEGQTKLLYISIVLVCSLLAFLTQTDEDKLYVDGNCTRKFHIVPFVFVFVILWFFSAFFTENPDYNNYCIWVQRINFSNCFTSSTEIGFNFIIAILKFVVGNDYHVVLFIIKSLSIVIIAKAFHMLRYTINLPFGIISYILFFYFDSIMLIRIALALSFLILACTYFLLERKRLIFAILTVCAALIHSSAIIMLALFLIVYIAYYRHVNKLWLSIISIAFIIGLLSVNKLSSFFMGNLLSKYSVYTISYSKLGLGFILIVAIQFLAIFIINKFNPDDKYLFTIDYLFLISILFRIMGYYNATATRLNYYSSIIYYIFIPYFMNKNTDLQINYIGKGKVHISQYGLVLLLSMIVIGAMGMSNAITYIPTYKFFNPFAM